MTDYGVLLENPRRRRRRKKTPARTKSGRFRKRASSSRRRRRNPGAVMVARRANPRRRRRSPTRRRRAAAPRRRRTTARRRRNPALIPRMGDMRRAFTKGAQMLVAEFAGDVLSRVGTKFGLGRLLTTLRVPAQMTVPATRIAVGLLGPSVLGLAPRMFKPDFRSTFAAINIASGLIGLTMNMRTRAFATMGLAGYDELSLYDWETADDGVGDWETADDGVGGYELADVGPPAGILGYEEAAGVLGDYY